MAVVRTLDDEFELRSAISAWSYADMVAFADRTFGMLVWMP